MFFALTIAAAAIYTRNACHTATQNRIFLALIIGLKSDISQVYNFKYAWIYTVHTEKSFTNPGKLIPVAKSALTNGCQEYTVDF